MWRECLCKLLALRDTASSCDGHALHDTAQHAKHCHARQCELQQRHGVGTNDYDFSEADAWQFGPS